METKFCKGCETDLPLTDEFFASRYDRKNKLFQSTCRKCQKIYRKKHYENNKAKYIGKAKEFTKGCVDWFVQLKESLKCEQCSENRSWVLDFHHKDPKEKDIEVSLLVRKGNKQKVLDEISKCIVLCANCHRDLHYQEKINNK
jgi:hypothetical protein